MTDRDILHENAVRAVIAQLRALGFFVTEPGFRGQIRANGVRVDVRATVERINSRTKNGVRYEYPGFTWNLHCHGERRRLSGVVVLWAPGHAFIMPAQAIDKRKVISISIAKIERSWLWPYRSSWKLITERGQARAYKVASERRRVAAAIARGEVVPEEFAA